MLKSLSLGEKDLQKSKTLKYQEVTSVSFQLRLISTCAEMVHLKDYDYFCSTELVENKSFFYIRKNQNCAKKTIKNVTVGGQAAVIARRVEDNIVETH